MDKILRYLFVLLASVSFFTACQKDGNDTVDLNAVIDDQPVSNAKVYIDGKLGYWQQGDVVRVRSGSVDEANYTLNVGAGGSSATIPGVTQSTPYTAGYPAANVKYGMGDGTLTITFPNEQTYTAPLAYSDGTNKQYIECPMAAYSDDGTELRFYNVGAVLAVNIHNSVGEALTLHAIEVESDNAPLTGTATVTVNADTAYITAVDNTRKSVIMKINGTVSLESTKDTTIFVPILPIAESQKSQLTVHVMASGSNKYTFHDESRDASGIYIHPNRIGVVPVNLDPTSSETTSDPHFWGKGTSACPFMITNAADLVELRDVVNGTAYGDNTYNTSGRYYRQTNDIDFTSQTTWGASSNLAIGNATLARQYFNANYDGGGHSVTMGVTGLTAGDISSTSYIGLFGNVGGGGSIKNLTMTGTINAVAENVSQIVYMGALVGRVVGDFTIEKCRNEIGFTSFSVTGSSTKKHYCGGICGGVTSGNVEFKKDTNAANITGIGSNEYHIGGICGSSADAGNDVDMCYCVNEGMIYATITTTNIFRTGGIMGYVGSTATFDHCINKEIKDGSTTVNTVSGTKAGVGGVVGYSKSSVTFSDCTNEGKVYGSSSNVGGILGQGGNLVTLSGKISNTGAIEGTTRVGGIIGMVGGISIEDGARITNGGQVTSSGESAGGILGNGGSATLSVDLYNCTNEGNVQGTKYVGGIVGNMYRGTIGNCGNDGNITATVSSSNSDDAVAGIVGYVYSSNKTYESIIHSCYNKGTIEGKGARGVAGIVGYDKDNCKIFNCYNQGLIKSSNDRTGGIAGQIIGSGYSSEIRNCYVAAESFSSSAAKSIYGYLESKTLYVSDCYNDNSNECGTDNANFLFSKNGSNEYVTNNNDKKLKTVLNEWRTGDYASYCEWTTTATGDDQYKELPHLKWEDPAPAAKRKK